MLSGKVFVKKDIVREQTFVTAEVSCSGQRGDSSRDAERYHRRTSGEKGHWEKDIRRRTSDRAGVRELEAQSINCNRTGASSE